MTTNSEHLDQLQQLVTNAQAALDVYDQNRDRFTQEATRQRLQTFDRALGYRDIIESPSRLQLTMRDMLTQGYSVVDFAPVTGSLFRMTFAPQKLPTQKQRSELIKQDVEQLYDQQRQPFVIQLNAAQTDLDQFKSRVREQQLQFDQLCAE